MGRRLARDLIRQAMAEMGSRGGKRSLETMTAAERLAHEESVSGGSEETDRRPPCAKRRQR